MSGPEFFQTVMGKRFFEGTVPELVKQLARIADALERGLPLLEDLVRASQAAPTNVPVVPPAGEKDR